MPMYMHSKGLENIIRETEKQVTTIISIFPQCFQKPFYLTWLSFKLFVKDLTLYHTILNFNPFPNNKF